MDNFQAFTLNIITTIFNLASNNMFLLKNIQKSIEKTVLDYTHAVAEKYGIPQDDLVEMWTEVSKMRIKTASNQSKRMSPWLRFCKEERVKMKTENPELSFGTISKRIGEKWSSMSKEERDTYVASIATPETTNPSPPSSSLAPEKASPTPKKNASKKTAAKKDNNNAAASTTTVAVVGPASTDDEDGAEADASLWTRENLEKRKIEELRELCSNVQLSKSGKKSDLVHRLLMSIQYSSNGDTSGWTKVTTAPTSDGTEEETASVSSEFGYDYTSDT